MSFYFTSFSENKFLLNLRFNLQDFGIPSQPRKIQSGWSQFCQLHVRGFKKRSKLHQDLHFSPRTAEHLKNVQQVRLDVIRSCYNLPLVHPLYTGRHPRPRRDLLFQLKMNPTSLGNVSYLYFYLHDILTTWKCEFITFHEVLFQVLCSPFWSNARFDQIHVVLLPSKPYANYLSINLSITITSNCLLCNFSCSY